MSSMAPDASEIATLAELLMSGILGAADAVLRVAVVTEVMQLKVIAVATATQNLK